MTIATTSEAFFDAKYLHTQDPWDFATNVYELERYDRILHTLAGRHFRLAYEPGCSVGVLTEKLAALSEKLEACDLSKIAVERAQQRCQNLTNVHIRHASLEEFVPEGADLYVFSEIGYYRTHDDLQFLLKIHIDALAPGATLVACHWRGVSPDHILSGDEVHEALNAAHGLTHEYNEVHAGFRLDRWAKREADHASHHPYRHSYPGTE